MRSITETELKEISGGSAPQVILGIFIYDAITDLGRGFAEGFKDGQEEAAQENEESQE